MGGEEFACASVDVINFYTLSRDNGAAIPRFF